jgi:small-conductance mechanosensitive channel
VSPNRKKMGAPSPAAPAQPTAALPVHQGGILPRGRIPTVGVREIVAAIHRRRERRRESAAELSVAIGQLGSAVEQHLARIAELRQVVEKQGGDLSQLQFYDNAMARLRAELRAAERSLAEAFSVAAKS